MKAFWSRLGGQLGVAFILLGFLLVFLGWNGAASRNRVPAQFPYLISGGMAGLCLVVIGVGMLIVQNQRADRAALQATLTELLEAVERSSRGGVAVVAEGSIARVVPAGMVVAGAASYHRASCRLLENRPDTEVLSPEDARERGLASCRICSPDDVAVDALPSAPVEDEAFAPPARKAPRPRRRSASTG